MKKFFKIAAYLVGALVIIILAGFIYFVSKYPDVSPAPLLKVERTPARIARGRYLANNVAGCIDCHSMRDWTKFSGPVLPGAVGKGGQRVGSEFGIPGTIYMKNITPAALKNWTDGEIFRVITSGVNKDGKVIFPMMPYTSFRRMSQEDIYSIIAYVRTLDPVENTIPESDIDFPVNLLIKTIPKDYEPQQAPDPSDKVKYGEYLVTIGGCEDCHTPQQKGTPVPGRNFSGGNSFKLPWGIVRPANITPDKETGIGNWTKDQFIARFKAYADDSAFFPVGKKDFNTVMPWPFLSGMTEEDLGAIYEYLFTRKPVRNMVVRFEPLKE